MNGLSLADKLRKQGLSEADVKFHLHRAFALVQRVPKARISAYKGTKEKG